MIVNAKQGDIFLIFEGLKTQVFILYNLMEEDKDLHDECQEIN